MRVRLRRPPSPHTVPSSLPLLFFGDIFTARVATVGLNPSDREYVWSRTGHLLSGREQRFATLASLGAADRASLTDVQCDAALGLMRAYFRPGRPAYWRWFSGLERVLHGLGASLSDGSATHLDLVQEATHPTWSALPRDEHDRLLRTDLEFLEWQIRHFPLRVVICTSATVSLHMRHRFQVSETAHGSLRLVTWWVGSARIEGRMVGFGGWNLPLARATGLGAYGEQTLGKVLGEHLGP